MKKVIIIGPAHPLRGGLASFDQRLCLEFQNAGYDASIYSFSLQYPDFLFPGTTQYSSDPAPSDIKIVTAINSINPFNWIKVGLKLKQLKPDLVVVRFWLPLMGPALGSILRLLKGNKHSKIVAITDNIIPHEKRPGDRPFTRYFLKSCDGFVTMSTKVLNDLRSFEKNKPAKEVKHPLYDNFGEAVLKSTAKNQLGIDVNQPIVLFFGFIRKYKGLDLLLDAISLLKQKGQLNFKLLVAGEYYEESAFYLNKIKDLGIENDVIQRTEFIPDSEVRYYLSAADLVVQPYRNATQSGVTPLAYHFEKPMIVTNVGGLPSLVPHNKVGLVCEPNAESIADAIIRYFELGEEFFLPHLREEKSKYSWSQLMNTLTTIVPDKTIRNDVS
ncbi:MULTISPECIES: glycosyltransferase [unclassified Paraflavitalea]|uniref:glycosyltransferase n=1 Tax=unclassified Paraflavitalea TaxID=2798305 RepID=UPI003D32CEDA